MKRVIVRATCALGVLVVLAFSAGIAGSAAASDAGWYGPYPDGCFYLWDGLEFSGYDCTQSTVYGWYGPYEDGCYYLWDGYQFISVDCSAIWSTVSTIGGEGILGGFTVSNFTPGTGMSTIGGQSLDFATVPTTGIPEIDAINQAANNANIALWLQPTCVYISGDICYIN